MIRYISTQASAHGLSDTIPIDYLESSSSYDVAWFAIEVVDLFPDFLYDIADD